MTRTLRQRCHEAIDLGRAWAQERYQELCAMGATLSPPEGGWASWARCADMADSTLSDEEQDLVYRLLSDSATLTWRRLLRGDA